VSIGSAMDTEASARGTTVYLPETTVRMLPDPVSTGAASLTAGVARHVLTTDVELSASGELLRYKIYPELVRVGARLTYEEADRILDSASGSADDPTFALLDRLRDATAKLRECRRAAGARLIHRREPKVTVIGDVIDIKIVDSASPSRELVAECMVLSNYVTARAAADQGVPMIYRVQPNNPEDLFTQRARLSVYPEFHAGVGLECYVQASSPIRRYVDLVAQRQIISILQDASAAVYGREELLAVLAAAETTEAEGRDLERRAKRYWTLTYLKRNALERPLTATILRDGASAELEDYGVRGGLRGAPNLPVNARITVSVARVEPVRGWLTLNYMSTVTTAEEDAV